MSCCLLYICVCTLNTLEGMTSCCLSEGGKGAFLSSLIMVDTVKGVGSEYTILTGVLEGVV